MNKADLQKDLELARQLCVELRSGNNEAILNLYNMYQPFFFGFAGRRLYSPDYDKVQTLLNDFWVELLNGRAICGYEGKASLLNYLIKILKYKIIDSIRRDSRRKEPNRNAGEWRDETETVNDSPSSPEQDLIKKEKQKIIHEALLMLSAVSPKDAHLVRIHLDGLSYRQMAQLELSDMKHNKAETDKKTNAIKKQFTRKRTGSLSKFRVCLERCMRKNKIKQEDTLNYFIYDNF
jgi:RNA polymerase sigma-70 factor (ECF subfamily)